MILLAAAAGKRSSIDSFQATLQALGVDVRRSISLSWIVVALEFSIALVGLSQVAPHVAAVLLTLSYLAFALTSVFGSLRSPGLNCACFGILRETTFSRRAALGRVVVAVLCAGWAALALRWPPGTAPSPIEIAGIIGVSTVVFFGMSAASLGIGMLRDEERTLG